ncbi:rod shape-determining protein MreD [Ferrovibrio sp.]|uniref:rod shape-determining protein MreD n=1 Tax=Ferrovibrio sp. TaxID=1917215 RepID=UPI00311F99A5
MHNLLAQINRRLRAFLPLLSSLALGLIGLTPLGMPYLELAAPSLALMAVFYWSIFRADLMTMLGAFLIGLAIDLLSGGPVGLNAMMLLLAHELGVSQRRVFLGSSFLVNWSAFALVASAAILAGWLLISLLYWTLLPVAPRIAQWALSLAVYPAVYWLLSRIERRWLRRMQPA